MNISPYEFEKAKEGSLFVKRKNKLVSVSFEDLSRDLKIEVFKIAELEHKYSVLSKSLKEHLKLVNASFINVFTLFELKALKGEIEVDEELLNLDEKVISGKLTVEEALKKHEYLEKTYHAIYGKEGE